MRNYHPQPGPLAGVGVNKVELVYWPATTFTTRAEAEYALVGYIDGWYNPRRIQASLGGLSPDEYEDAYHRAHPKPHR